MAAGYEKTKEADCDPAHDYFSENCHSWMKKCSLIGRVGWWRDERTGVRSGNKRTELSDFEEKVSGRSGSASPSHHKTRNLNTFL